MDIRPATLVREVDPSEPWSVVVDEAKGLTWTGRCEHALISVEDGRLLLVSGGADGLLFEERDGKVWVRVNDEPLRVVTLAWHTHPRATGPSDHDRQFLRLLAQRSSMIYEMFTTGEGTRFKAFDREEEP